MSTLRPTDIIINPERAREVPAAEIPRYVTALGTLLQRTEIALDALTARVPEVWNGTQREALAPTPSTLTPEDLAGLLHKTPRGVHAMLRTRQLPGGFKVGKLWRIRRQDFEKWQEDQQSSDNRTGARVQIRRVRKGSE